MIFYKYRNDSKYTEEIFTSGNVWLSTAEQLNDPFECSIQEVAAEWIDEKVKEAKTAQLAGFVASAYQSVTRGVPFFTLVPKQTRKLLDKLKRLQSMEAQYGAFRKAYREITGGSPSDPTDVFRKLDEQLQAVGIFSMSRHPDHPLMWAHYSANHTGIVLGFEATPGSPLADSIKCVPVEYRDTVPQFSGGLRVELSILFDPKTGTHKSKQELSFNDETFQAAVRTKATTWSYEDEWRYIEPTAGKFPWPGRIAEIVFGLRCPAERRSFYRSLAAKHVPNSIEFFQIEKIPNTNSLRRVRFGE